jgi:hypothetical protein
VKHHFTRAYHEALLSIVTSQLDASRSHADGLQGLLALLKEVPLVQEALQARASAELAGTLAGAMRGLGAAVSRRMLLPPPLRGGAANRHATATSSQHANLLLAAGGDAGIAALFAGSDDEGDDLGSVDEEAHVPPVAILDDDQDVAVAGAEPDTAVRRVDHGAATKV